MTLGSKCVINEKFTILIQSCSYFANLTYYWVDYFDQVSSELPENWRFFTNGTFSSQCHFFRDSLYVQTLLSTIKSSNRKIVKIRNSGLGFFDAYFSTDEKISLLIIEKDYMHKKDCFELWAKVLWPTEKMMPPQNSWGQSRSFDVTTKVQWIDIICHKVLCIAALKQKLAALKMDT